MRTVYLGGSPKDIENALRILPNARKLVIDASTFSFRQYPIHKFKAVTTKVKHLSFTGNPILSDVPSEIGEFRFLHSLDLSRNGLTENLDSIISKFPKLSRLNLSHNRFEGTVPLHLIRPSITHLDISHNQFDSFPVSVPNYALPGFVSLKISYNPIQIFPDWLLPLTTLEVLECDFCDLHDLPISRLWPLRVLRCAGNRIRNLAFPTGDASDRIDESYAGTSPMKIEILDCSGNELVELMCDMPSFYRLKYLNCVGNRIKNLFLPICPALDIKNLNRVVNVGENEDQKPPAADNRFADAMEGLIMALDKISDRTTLASSDSMYSPNQRASAGVLPPDVLVSSSFIRRRHPYCPIVVLRCSHNDLASVPRALENAPFLTILDIGYNNLKAVETDNGNPLQASDTPCLRELRVNGNESLDVFPDVILGSDSLIDIDLSHTTISSLPDVDIMQQMKQLRSLSLVDTEVYADELDSETREYLTQRGFRL